MAKALHIKTAFSAIRRSPFQAVAAVFVLSVTFFIVTVLSVLLYSSDKVINYFETQPQVIAFLKSEAGQSEILTLKNKLEGDSRVKDVRFVSKADAVSFYKEATVDNPLLSELVSPSIFPASLEFSLSNLSEVNSVINELKTEEVVDQVGFTASLGDDKSLETTVSKLKDITYYLRLGGGIFVAMLIFTSLMVLLVIISMRISSRKNEVEILDLIGATAGFIRAPILMEAILYSFFGVFLGWLLGVILILYSTPSIVSYFSQIPVLPRNTVDLFVILGIVFAFELLVGLVIALAGSMFAVSRARRK